VIRVPFERAFSITNNIKAGFSKCGIYPFNPDAIAQNMMLPSCTTPSSSDTSSGGSVAFAPLPVERSKPLSSQLQCSSISMPTSPIVSSPDSQNSSGVSCSTPTTNPLVTAGLILPELADILTPPTLTKEPTKRIVGGRDLKLMSIMWLKGEEEKKKAEEKEKRA
jgi:hypothetical protein